MKLKNVFKKKLKPRSDLAGIFKIEHIDDESDHLHVGLGISDKRCKELSDMVMRGTKECTNAIKVADYFSDKCLHANEFFYCVYILAANVENNNRRATMMDILAAGD